MATQSTPPKDGLDPSITSAWQSSDVAMRYKAAENATRPFAAIMVEKCGLADTIRDKDANIFDLACGTGAVEAEIYAAVPKQQWGTVKVLAGDISEPMLEYLQKRGESEGWKGVKTSLVDGKELKLPDPEERFTHVFVGFGIFVMPPDTLTKLSGKLEHGGYLAISTWANLPWYGILGRTYERMDDAPVLPSQQQLWRAMTNGKAWDDRQFVEQQLKEAGLERVEVVQRKIQADGGTPDIFMTTMGFVLGMLSKQWEEGKRERWLKEAGDSMKAVLVEEAGGPDKHVFMDSEGIVGIGWKGE